MDKVANEEWRRDPKRRYMAKHLCEKRARLYAMLIEDLEKAERVVRMLKETGEEKPTAYNQYRTLTFLDKIEDAKEKHKYYTNPTDTLIGNMAAFGEGNG